MGFSIAGVLDPANLFGMSDTEQKVTSKKVKGSSKYSPEQLDLLKDITNYYDQWASGAQLPTYEGERVAGLSTAEQQALSSIMGYTPYYTSEGGGAGINTIAGQLMSGNYSTDLEQLGTGAVPDYSNITAMLDKLIATPQSENLMTQAYKANIEQPMMENWNEDIMPQLKEFYNSKGLFYGSDREKGTEKSAKLLMDELNKGRTQLYSDIQEQAINAGTASAAIKNTGFQNQLSRVNQSNAANQQMFTNLLQQITEGTDISSNFGKSALQEMLGITGQQATLGKTQRDIEQEKLTTKYEDWLQNQPGNRPFDSMIMQILGVSPYYDQQVGFSGQQSDAQNGQAAVGAAAAAAAAAA